MINKTLNFKIGNAKTDLAIGQYFVWVGSLAFFMLVITQLPNMEITQYQLLIGIILASIFLLIGIITGFVIGMKK